MSLTKTRRAVTYKLPPTGDPATDVANFEAIIAAIPASGGQIVIADNGNKLALDSNVSAGVVLTKPLFIRGETRNAQIESRGVGYYLNWGGWETPPAVTPNTLAAPSNNSIGVATFSGLNQFESEFQSPNLTLVKGDWVCLMADDPVPGNTPHLSGETRPFEIHRVAFVSGSDVVLSSPVKEAMTINPRLQKMDMMRNCGMADLLLSSNIQTAGTSTRTTAIIADKVLQFRVENVEVDDTGIGSLFIKRAADCLVSNFSGRSQPNPFIDYSVVVLAVNGFRFTSSYWNESRHVFTTTGYDITGNHRYGGTIACKVDHVNVCIGGDVYNNKYAVFDSHPEGSDIEFESCEVHAGALNEVTGFNVRAKRTHFNNCKFYGNSYFGTPDNIHVAFKVGSVDNEFINCHVEKVWKGWEYQNTNAHDGQLIDGCHFVDCSTVAIRCTSAVDNIHVLNNNFVNCGWFDNAGTPLIPKTITEITGGTGHVLRGNQMDKDANDYAFHFDNLTSSDMTIEGNYVKGYGATFQLGVRGAINDPNAYSNTTGESIDSTWAASNYTD